MILEQARTQADQTNSGPRAMGAKVAIDTTIMATGDRYDDLVLGSGAAGKLLAWRRAKEGRHGREQRVTGERSNRGRRD